MLKSVLLVLSMSLPDVYGNWNGSKISWTVLKIIHYYPLKVLPNERVPQAYGDWVTLEFWFEALHPLELE